MHEFLVIGASISGFRTLPLKSNYDTLLLVKCGTLGYFFHVSINHCIRNGMLNYDFCLGTRREPARGHYFKISIATKNELPSSQ